VYDALVVGVPDQRWGERVTAVVQPVEGASVTPDELIAHCKKQIAGHKVPRAVLFVDRVQRSPVGKADYAWAKSAAVEAGI
jgi:acyl-CoA synthetase (AMP-forming)/AMP-acid ligase II